MKAIKTMVLMMAAAALSGCGGLVGNGGGILNGGTIGDVIASVIGLDKPTERQLIGSWRYQEPGVAFTSEKLLAKAGGEVVAAKVKSEARPIFQKVGINASNTQLTLNADHTFRATVAGRSLSGTYTYDPETCRLDLKALFLTVPCYVKGGLSSMNFLFEASKLLTVVQIVSSVSGNANLQTIGKIASQYDGLRLGFEMAR